MKIEQLIQSDATIVDVRSKLEYLFGKVPGSINIPLNEIPGRIKELKSMKQPLVLCCASGNRSGQAVQFLAASGIKSYNGGSWQQVKKVKGA